MVSFMSLPNHATPIRLSFSLTVYLFGNKLAKTVKYVECVEQASGGREDYNQSYFTVYAKMTLAIQRC